MSALTVTLGADITALRRAMAGATELVAASARRMGKMTSAGLAGLGKGGSAALSKGFDMAAIGLKAGIGAALAGGAAAMGVGVKAVNSAADFEQTKVAFTTLIGDAAKAEQTLAKLRTLGAETPFEFPELADAGRKLIAFGESADTVPETLRRIGDVSAGIQAPINEIAEIYGKARVQGRLFAEDVNQLTGRGIPIIGELAKQFGVNESQVRKLTESGQVGFPQIEKAFVNMTSKGGKFYGMMEEQSKTTKGLFSTLKDTFNEVFLALGTPINDAIRPLVAEAINLVSQLAPMAAEAGKNVKDGIMFIIAAFKSGIVLELVTSSLKLGFAVAINSLINGFRAAVSFLFYFISNGTMWKGLGTVLLGLAGSFGLAILNAFETPITYLKAGIEWCVAWMLKGLLKVPGMSKLMGIEYDDVNSSFKDILKDANANRGKLFGIDYKELQETNTGFMESTHYIPVKPDVNDDTGTEGKYFVKLFKLDDDDGTPMVTAWQQSDIEHWAHLWTAKYTGEGQAVYKGFDGDKGVHIFRRIDGRGYWHEDAHDDGIAQQIQVVKDTTSNAPEETIRVIGNGRVGSLVWKDCDGNEVMRLEWNDGLITSSGDYEMEAGCDGWSSYYNF